MRFSRMQISFVLIVYFGISNRMVVVPHLLALGKRDAWLCVIIAYVFILLWGTVLYLIMRRNRQRAALYDWMKARAGGFISHVLMIVFTIYVTVISAITFYDLIQSVSIYFLPRTPSFVVMVPFLLLGTYSAYKGLKSIVRVSAVVLPIIWFLEIFLTLITNQQKDYAYLFPVLLPGASMILWRLKIRTMPLPLGSIIATINTISIFRC